MTEQKYSLSPNEKFAVWFTTMLMMTEEQLDHDSKVRVVKMAKTIFSGEDVNIKKIENDDPEEVAKYQKKIEEIEAMKEAIRKEINQIKRVLDACYGEVKVKEDCNHQTKKNRRWKN